QIRDAKYDGDPRWVYALVATNRPHVSHVYPIAGNPGQVLEVQPVMGGKTDPGQIALPLPATEGIYRIPLEVGGGKINPVTCIVSALPQVAEQEPNDAPTQANRIAIPCGINGRIGQKRDLDHFVFAGQKGRAIRFEVKARRFGTDLQSS